jgi:hypothetical protein
MYRLSLVQIPKKTEGLPRLYRVVAPRTPACNCSTMQEAADFCV